MSAAFPANLEAILDRFDDAWNEPTPPRIEDYLTEADPDQRVMLLIELVRIDLERRLAAGEKVRLEEFYFPRFPKLAAETPAIVTLVKHEYAVRRRNEPELMLAEYLERFPQCGMELLAQLPTLDETRDGEIQPKTADVSAGLDLRGYELIEMLGVGGMGEVYRCVDPALGRDLAIKVIKKEYRGNQDIERRFLREARITGSLQHPNIVAVYNLGRLADGRLHYTMRIVRGQQGRGRTLAHILKEDSGKAEHLPSLLAIYEKVCEAMAYAHSKRVIHRDLKPANIMVGKFGEVQVMDWGLAKLLTAVQEEPQMLTGDSLIHTELHDSPGELTRANTVIGTPHYMPPEQAQSDWELVDERTDVFALGSILCEMLTGQPAYHGQTQSEVLRRAKRGDLADALRRLENCGADAMLTRLCRECLSYEREGRPRDAGVVAERVKLYQTELQERLRRAELERVEAESRTREEHARVLVEQALKQEALAREARKEESMRAVAEALKKEVKAGRLSDDMPDISALSLIRVGPRFPYPEISEKVDMEASYFIHYHEQKLKLSEIEHGHAGTLTLLHRTQLAYAYYSLYGYNDETIRLFEQLLAQHMTLFGSDHGDTLDSQSDLAIAYRDARRIGEALALLEKAQNTARRTLGDTDPKSLRIAFELAYTYYRAGQFARAEPIYRGTLEKTRVELPDVVIGKDHPIMADQMALFAKTLLRLHKYTEAEIILRSCLQRLEDIQLEDWTTVNIRSLLGEALQGQKKYTESEPLLLHSYERMKKLRDLFPPGKDLESEEMSEALERLIRFYQATGKKDEVAKWLKESQPSPSQEGRQLPNRRALLANHLLHKFGNTRYVKGMLLSRLQMEERQQLYGWTTGNAHSLLGEALLDQKKYAEAEPLLLQGYERMKESKPEIALQGKARLIEALERLVRFYEATDREDKAVDWRKKLQETKAARKEPKP